MKFLLILTGVLLGGQSWAQGPSSVDPLAMEGQGSVLAMRLVLGEKSAKIFFVGSEVAKLGFEKDAKILQITAFNPNGTKEELRFVPGQGFYTIQNMPAWPENYMLEVKAKYKEKNDKVQLKIQVPKKL